MRVRLTRDVKDPSGETDEVIPAGTVLNVADLSVSSLTGGYCFSVTAEEVEIIPPTFEDLGFTVWEMDGGGMAYGLAVPDGYILVTDAGGSKLPEDDDPVLVGIYGANSEPEITTYGTSEYAIHELKKIVTSIPA
jgi:hypothetical protein